MYILDYIKTVNPEQYRGIAKYIKKAGAEKFLKDTFKNGIYIHQPPFWNNVNIDELKAIYEKYDWIEKYKCFKDGKEMREPLIIAPVYFMKLMF